MFSTSLRAFDATVRAGSIRKASEMLGVAPSSVGRHIAVLEAQFCTKLFHRTTSGLELTHAGRLAAEFARSVLVDYDALRTDLSDLGGTQRRHLRVALVESVAHYGPIDAIAQFRKKYRGVSFTTRVMPAPQIVEAVRQSQFDVGVTFCAEPTPDVSTVASLREPIVLFVSAGHPLAAASSVDLSQIVALPLAVPDSDFGVRHILDRAAAASGLRIAPVLSSNAFETLRDFVRLEAGAAILPMRAAAAREGTSEFKAIPLVGRPFTDATLDIVVHRTRRPPNVVKTFVDCLVQAVASIAQASRPTGGGGRGSTR